MDYRLAIAVAVAVALFSALQALYWYVRGRRQRHTSELRQRVHGRGESALDVHGIRIRGKEVLGAKGNAQLRRVGEALEQGGFQVTPGRFLSLCGAGVLGAWVLGAVVTGSALSGTAMAAFVAFAVYAYIVSRRDQRLKQISAELPRTLELMIFALQAGHALEEALHVAAQEAGPPLSAELERCYEEYSLGRPIEAALEQLRDRWPSVHALNSLVEAVVVLKRTGGNLVEVLDTMGDGLRAQAAYEQRHRALTAEGRASAMILMGLPFVGLLSQALLSPDDLANMARDVNGQIMLAIGFLMWVAGSAWVLKLSKPTRGGT